MWQFDDLALRGSGAGHAARAPASRAGRRAQSSAYGLFGRANAVGYVQRLAVAPSTQGTGLGRALLGDGLEWLRSHGAAHALVNTQDDNARGLALYLSAGFARLPVGLCVLGRDL